MLSFLQPKIFWYKNKLPLEENPRYRQLFSLGICSLEIRKVGNYDGGEYTCKAKNALGEEVVACKLEVKKEEKKEEEGDEAA